MKLNQFIAFLALSLFISSCSNDDEVNNFNPSIEIGVETSTYAEDTDSVNVTFTTTEPFTEDITLVYEVSGSATADEDFESLDGSITIPAGASTVSETIIFLEDDKVESDEEITITLVSAQGSKEFLTGTTSITIIIADNDSFAYENGIFVVHEGSFFGGNASISFVTNDLSNTNNSIFTEVNDRPLGDTAQSIAFSENLAFIVVNNSQKIEVVNRYTFESVATIGGPTEDDFLNPRYMAIANGKGYVTNWGDGTNPDDDFIAVLNLESFTVESKMPVAEGPEWIVSKGDTIYVAHQGGFNQNNILSVIDATLNTVKTTITVADRPNSMHLVEDNLFVLSGGNPAWTGNETSGQLDIINTLDNTVTSTLSFETTQHPNYLSVDGNMLYYLLDGAVYAMSSSATELPTAPEFTGVSFYDMTVHNGKLYGVDAKDFASNGSLEVYDLSTNTQQASLEVNIVPGAVYFNDAFDF